MAIVVLMLWFFTAGAGFYLLATSNLRRSVPVTAAIKLPASVPAHAAASVQPESGRSAKQTLEDRIAPPSLVASRQAPVVPGARALLEFAHPACGIVGLGFWLGYTFIHYKPLGWIAVGLVAVTACAGLSWFAANLRSVKRHEAATSTGEADPPPSFKPRLVMLHGAGAFLTIVLAALSALVLH